MWYLVLNGLALTLIALTLTPDEISYSVFEVTLAITLVDFVFAIALCNVSWRLMNLHVVFNMIVDL